MGGSKSCGVKKQKQNGNSKTNHNNIDGENPFALRFDENKLVVCPGLSISHIRFYPAHSVAIT